MFRSLVFKNDRHFLSDINVKAFRISLFFLILFSVAFTSNVFANGGIGYKGVKLNLNGSSSWYNVHGVSWGYQGCGDYGSTFYNSGSANWNGTNLGSFSTTATLQITGYAVVGWTDNTDYVAGKLEYKVWKQGDSEPGSWTVINIGNYQSPTSGATQVVCTSGNDRVVGYNNGTASFQPGVAGTYNFKVKGFGRMQYTGGGGGSFNDNDGSELTATFTITSSAPTISSTSSTVTSNNTQTYKGATITINGTNLGAINSVKIGGSGGASCTSVTVVNSTQVTAVVPDGTTGGTIWVSNGTNNATSTDSYTNLGFISTTTGNWATGGTWLGSTAPSSTDKATIASGHTVTLAANATIAQLTVNSGGTYSGSSNTLSVAGNLSNSGTFTASTGTISFTAAGTVTGTITFNNLTIAGAVALSAASTVNGTLQLNSGGSVTTNSPIYGASSTLTYNQGGGSGSKFNQSLEWPSSNPPRNVTITNNTWVQLTGNRSLAGNLTVTNGALQGTGALRSLTMNGTTQTITISTSSGGAIYGTDNGSSNDLQLVIANGSTTTLTGDATGSSDDEKKFHTININSGGTLALSRGILCRYGTFTVSGTLQINSGGYVQSGPTSAVAASYSSGTLVYNNGGSYTTTNFEWPASNTPSNVTLQNSGTNVTLNANKTVNGNLIVRAGTTLNLSTFTLGSPSSTTLEIGTTGSVISGSGTLTLGGNLTVNNISGSGGASVSCPVALGATRIFTVADGSAAADLTISGIISGSTFGVTKEGAGNLVFSGANSYTGSTTITAGTLQLSASERISNNSNVVLNGGTFSSGASTGFTETAGTLNLNANSTIALGTGSHSIIFSASNGVSWAGTTLTVTGWTGSSGQSGSAGKIFVGSNTSGLTSTQLDKINFAGYNNGADILSTGEVVPRCGNPTSGGTIASGQSICSGGDPAAFTSSADASGQTGTLEYKWQYSSTSDFSSDVNDIASTNSTTYDAPAGLTATRYYRRLARVTCKSDWTGAAASNILQVTVTATPSTPGTITGEAVQCSGASGQSYSISAVSGATSYTWTVPTGWSVTSGAGTTSITVTAGTTGQNGDITVTASNSCGTSSAQTLAVTVVAGAPSAPGTISGTATQCPGLTSQTYSISAVSGASTYTWTVPSGWTITGGQGTTSLTVTTGAFNDNGNISVTAGNSCGTSSAQTLAVTVAAGTPATPGSITGTTTQCAGATSQSYSISSVTNATTYTWTVPTGWSITAGQGTTSITVTAGSAGQNGNITVTAGNSCGTSSAQSLAVTVIATPSTPGTISGTTTQCAGATSQTYSISSVTYATTYTWTVPTGWSITAGQGSTSITVTAGSAGQNGNITVTAGNTCGTSSAQTLAVTAIATPSTPGTISGTATQCAGATSQIYSISSVTYATTYTWTVPTGWSITAGQGTTSITVTAGSAGQNGNITVTAGNACGTSSAQSLAVTVIATPSTPGTISGTATQCAGATSQTYSISSVTYATTYTWTVPTGWSITAGQGTTSITVTAGSAGQNGNITVTAGNTCGTSSAQSLAVTAITTPSTPGTITGTATQCAGATSQTYSISSVTYASTYTWTVPTGWSITAGQGTTSITVTAGSAGQNGNITVTAGNSCGTSSAQSLAVTVVATPATPGAISGTTTQCPGATSQTYSISSVTYATTYTWTVPTGWSITAGQGSTSITVTTGSAGQNGNITVTAGNSCGTSSAQTLAVTVTGTYTWVGSTSTNWNTAANWSCNAVPTTSTDVVIPSGTTYSPDISSAAANAKSVTINSSATLSMTGNYTLTIAAGGAFTNNGTVTSTNGTVNFAGAGEVKGSSATTFNNLTINTGAVTITTVPTINGVFQINGGNITASIKYGSSSTLRYNTTYSRYVEWDYTDVGTIGTSAGYPNNVEITAGTFSLKNGSNNARALEGSLTIASGATFTMEDITSNLTVKQNVTNNGTLTLSSAAGGNIKVGGNWTVGASATQTNNTRYVSFNGASGNQTIAKTGGGSVTFDVLVVDKAAGSVVVSSSPATNIIVSHNAGNVFRITNSGTFDLNGRKITFNNDNGSIYVDGSARTITSSVSGGTIDFNAYKSVVNNSGTGSLVIGSNVTVNLNANGNVDFGSGLTTINGTLSLNSTTSCYVNTNPPIYASGSTLVYNTGATYGRDLEWSAIGTVGVTPGYPHNVTINAGSSLDMGAHSGTGTARQISGSLLVDGGFYMDYSANDMTAAVTVSGNITIGSTGTLSLSEASGGDIKVNGDWYDNGTFNPKGRAVFFIGGSGDQQIAKSGGETFDFLIVDKTAGSLLLNDNITLNQTLTLTSGKITTGAQKVVITSTGGISGGSSTSYINGNLQRHFATGSSIARAYPIGDASTYAPATITMGTSSTAGSILLNTTGADHPNIGTYGLSATKYVKRYWSATNVGAVFSNTSIEFNYVAGDVQGSGVAANMKAARYTTGTGWTYPTTSGATTYKFTAGGITNSNLQNDYTAGECGGTISFTPSNNGPLCVGSTLNLLSGTVTGNIGSVSYSWSGPSSYSSTTQNPSITNAQTTNGGTYTLTVTDAAGCSNANTTSAVVNAGPTTSNAGPDQTKCNDGNFTLAGNNPGSGTGLWTVVSGTATITTPTAYNSTVTGVPAGTSATLRWTVSNNPCTPSSDDVVLANNALPTTANAGADQTLCNTSTFTMAGNNPTSGTGLWSIISGSATITNASLYNTTVTGVAAGASVTLRWTISNGVCSNSTDDVVISNNALPTTAAAGADQEQCNNGSFTLAGNTPTTGTGAWTVVSGTATITSASSPTSSVTGVPLGTSATLRWTISNGVCTPSTDDVVLTNSYPPDVANAGTDQANCQSGNFTLAGNNPANGTGAWTVISGTATITTPSAYNSTVTGVPAGTSATLRWTITNGTCTPTTDDVVLTNSNPPTTANAGADQSGCSSGTVTLAGNTPSSGTGTWTIQSGGSGTFSNANSATSTFSATTGTYVLRWTIATAGCTASYDETTITIVNSPTTANAGPDISQCNNSTFTMAGNTPVYGTGTWTVTSGSATITSPNSPTTTVTVAIGNTATLRWTIANAPCTDSWDEVVLSNAAANLWVGTTSSDWNTGSNWSCGVVPAAGSSITIPSGAPNNPNIGLSGANASIKDLTIDAGATLTMSSSYTLSFANGGTFTNNGTFTPGNGTIVFSGTGTISGSSNSTFNNVTINGGVDFGNGKSTINGTLQINGGGYVNTNAPKYGAASTLNYNVNGAYGRNLEWSASGTGTIGTTTGYPNNVVISNNTTLQMGANSGTGTARSLEGNLTVESGSTFSMSAGGAMTQPVTVKGNVTIDGAFALSTSAGGDMNVGGNWTVGASGTQTNNGRTVQFNSSTNATQTITKTGGGTIYFDYLNVNNTATNGKLMLSSSPATQLQINSTTNSTSSYQLQLTNGDLDLNGQTFEMNGTVPNSTNIQVSNGTRKITGSTGSSISITGTATAGTPNLKVYPSTGTDKLVIDGGASLQTSVGVVFTNTTFNGIFQINRHGFVAGSSLTADPPVYGVNSTLIYNNENPGFNRNYEWTAASGTLGTTPGYPNDVIVKGNTTPLDIANTGVSSGVRELGIAGTLEIESGSIVTMSAMNYPLTINGDIQLDGTLILSTNASGTLNIGGNWERGTSATFTQNSRPIRFFGTAPQTINATGGETFSYITVDKTTDKVSLISNLTVTNTIAIDNGTFDVSTGALVINDVITKGAGGSLISEETGTVVYDKTASSQSVIYAEYGNLTLSNASAKSMANNLAVRGDFTVSGGTVTPGADIRFSGNRDQAIAGLPNYTNMAFSGTGNHTKRFTSHGAFTGAMTFTGGVGTVDLDGSGDNVNFTAVSNASATARIANVNGWTVAGKAIVERYIPSQRKWRLISIPVTGETIRQSLTRQADGSYPSPSCFGSPAAPVGGSGTLITGHSMSSCTIANAQGYDHVVTGGLSSIRFYNPAQSNPWASLTSTPNVLSAPTQPGYLVFIRGDRNQLEVGSSETTLRPKGYVKQNDQTISINAPFVILGNPYASPIHLDQLYDFNDGTGNKTKITRNFWIWDADLNSSYGGVGGYRYISADIEGDEITSYTSVPSLPGGTNINDYLMVNSGQGIMVQRRNAGGTLTVKENYKYSSSGNTYPFRIKASTVSLFRIDLYRATGNTLEIMMDGTAARFGDEYNKASNEVYDIYKTNQFEENISLVRDNNYLSIESRPVPTSNDTLYVPFYFATERGYALRFTAERMAGKNLTAVLQDAFTATETQVPLDGSEFVYPFSVTTAAASKALNRFRVVFRPGSVTPVIDLFADKGINIYPNPVLKGETMNLQFKNKSAGKYLVTLYDAVGVRVFSKTVVHTGGNGVQKIELPKRLASGTYFAELTDGKGNQGKMKVIIQ